VYREEEEERSRIAKLIDILDLDFLEFDGLDVDLLALDETETWYTELDYDPLALEFLFDALDQSNAELAALLKSEFEDIEAEEVFGYKADKNISILNADPDFVVIREDGAGNYIRLQLSQRYAYALDIDQNGSSIRNYSLALQPGTPAQNDITITQNK